MFKRTAGYTITGPKDRSAFVRENSDDNSPVGWKNRSLGGTPFNFDILTIHDHLHPLAKETQLIHERVLITLARK